MATQRETAEEWLKYSIQNWRSELRRLRIKHTDELFNSFKGNVIDQAGGDRLKLEISYAWYGQMVDMGVGRGTRSGEQKEKATERRLLGKMRGNRRRPKPWYSRGRNGIGYQVLKLSELMGQQMAATAVEKIAGSIDEKLIINF